MNKYRVEWIEYHSCEVSAIDEEDAKHEAVMYAGGHNTFGASDNFDVSEVI